ncbi:hypothetical protein BpHYR1_053831 [Brachionus plicatilis]|uniref:Uncharacterized protein n=1 Tax=Brachionus plicatilis TaxID=10195 RepID=A0A3M7R4K4_BRAPC|nr:hypothetical protein BpHYR1_053831 [Brachionus plicatilis]
MNRSTFFYFESKFLISSTCLLTDRKDHVLFLPARADLLVRKMNISNRLLKKIFNPIINQFRKFSILRLVIEKLDLRLILEMNSHG